MLLNLIVCERYREDEFTKYYFKVLKVVVRRIPPVSGIPERQTLERSVIAGDLGPEGTHVPAFTKHAKSLQCTLRK